jgi:uncharacterized GH25 family protein
MKTIRLPMLATVLMLAGLQAMPAQAHRPWVLPSATQVEGENAYVTFDAAISEGLFDFDNVPVKLDGMVITGPDGQPISPENAAVGRRRSVFDLKLAQPGTYRVSIASNNVMASYMLNGEQKRWRGAEAELATAIPAGAENVQITRTEARNETFVTHGEATQTALAPTGKGLEIIPLTHPSDMAAGSPARFRALIDGKPAPDIDITVVPGGGRFRASIGDVSVKTNAAGEATVTWPMAGMVWLGANWPRREAAPAGPGGAGAMPPMGAGLVAAAGEGTPPAILRAPAPPRRLSYTATYEVAPF